MYDHPASRIPHPTAHICLLAALVLLLTSGCGSDYPPLGPVSGKVTVDGEPVPVGRIVFYPSKGRPAMGTIGEDASYELTTFNPGDGALVGNHTVTIKATRTTGSSGPKNFEEEAQGIQFIHGTTEWLVPQKYSDRSTTPLTAAVKAESNTINFDLISSHE